MVDPVSLITYHHQYDIFTVGSGYLDIPAALASTEVAQGTALSPIAVRDSSGNVLLQPDASSVWGTSVVWGSSLVWGSSALVNGTSLIWGSSVVWGSSTVNGYSLVWGSTVIWGSSVGATDSGSAAESVDGSGDPD
jgi:serine protease AprX